VPNILILIPSFNNKRTINVIVYIEFDVYVQFQINEVLGRRQRINKWSSKNEDRRQMCNL